MEIPLAPSLGENIPFDIGCFNTAHFDPDKTGKSYLKTPTGTVVISGTPLQQIVVYFSMKKEMLVVEGWGGAKVREKERQKQK